MDGLVLFGGLFLLGYPVLVAWIVVISSRRYPAAQVDDVLRDRIALLEARLVQQGQGMGEQTPAPIVVPETAIAPDTPAFPREAVPVAETPADISADPLLQRHSPRKALRERTPPAAAAIPAAPEATQSATPAPEALQDDAPSTASQPADTPQPSYGDAAPPAWLSALKDRLFTGNLVAKFGLLILFIGVSFLLKYAAERVTIPIELRLAGVVLADLALLGFGWRIRLTRRGIALPVQGAALAILMLVVFGAFQRYQLIPGGMAFALLFGLTVSTCLLAVLQDALWLAVFGICGGFAAPLMVSTGQGSHVALFSYYALLNAGVLAIAFKRSWRALNLLGFAFTFVIGSAWGLRQYQPADFASAEAFLILFFVFYVAVAIAWAGQQARKSQSYVDATLVFATPVIATALQYGLVRDQHFGMSLSVLALALFYMALALKMWRYRGSSRTLLIESFLALGVVFGTLTVPFALDARWTSGAWAMEGAAIVWIGLRQRRVLTWSFGLLVQAGAWMFFIDGMVTREGSSNVWLGFLLLAGAAFAMASSFRKQSAIEESSKFAGSANWLLAVASLWLLAGAWGQLIVSGERYAAHFAELYVGSALVVALLLVALARRTEWRVARAFAVIAQLLAAAALFRLHFFDAWTYGPPSLSGILMIVVSSLISSRYLDKAALGRGSQVLSATVMGMAAFWWYWPALTAITVRMPNWLGLRVVYADFDRHVVSMRWCLLMIGVALSSAAYALLAKRLAWPQLRRLSTATWIALPFWMATALLQLLWEAPDLPRSAWLATAALWLAGDWLVRFWIRQGWTLARPGLVALHALRSAGLLGMMWLSVPRSLQAWLRVDDEMDLLARAGWTMSADWTTFLTYCLLMALLLWLGTRARDGRWPTAPVQSFYRDMLLPLATAVALYVTVVMNLSRNGATAPLPYLPLVNPVDVTTALALLLAAHTARATSGANAAVLARLSPYALYAWFNLILLRSAAHVLDIDYAAPSLFASQAVQAMLSLTWSLSALVLMRSAARRPSRAEQMRRWAMGASLLGVVVVKLFIVDLANSGSVERIVSFVGVGVLMLVIGYFAPFPTNASTSTTTPPPAAV